MIPTDEQKAVLDAVASTREGALKIAAGPGTGKTAVLRMAAERLHDLGHSKILYLAYNKSLSIEAGAKFQGLADVRTIHSLAYRDMRVRQTRRALSPGIPARVYADILGVSPSSDRVKAMDPVLKRFFQSEATQILPEHARPSAKGGLDIETVVGDACDCFEALRPETGTRLPLTHDLYLKAWQLNGAPGLMAYHTVLLDEAQDASPIIVNALSRARHAIYVGDEHQQIYAWLGAVDAMSRISGPRMQLTHSFRFGPTIADAANRILDLKGADVSFRLRGNPTLDSTIASIDTSTDHTRIYWTNNALMDDFLFLYDIGRRPGLVSDSGEFTRLLASAWALYSGVTRKVRHPYVRKFDNFDDFRNAASARGGDANYALTIIDTLAERTSTVIEQMQSSSTDPRTWLTTAHRSKGAEWAQVLISADFDDLLDPDDGASKGASDEKWNLAYVAITRAQQRLELQSTVLSDLLGFD